MLRASSIIPLAESALRVASHLVASRSGMALSVICVLDLTQRAIFTVRTLRRPIAGAERVGVRLKSFEKSRRHRVANPMSF